MKQKYLSIVIGLLLCLSLPSWLHAGGGTVGSRVTPARLVSILTNILGIVGFVLGLLSLRRPVVPASRLRAMMAIVLGMVCLAISIIHLETVSGGFGSGSGKAGAIVGVAIGIAVTIIGVLGAKRLQKQRYSR